MIQDTKCSYRSSISLDLLKMADGLNLVRILQDAERELTHKCIKNMTILGLPIDQVKVTYETTDDRLLITASSEV